MEFTFQNFCLPFLISSHFYFVLESMSFFKKNSVLFLITSFSLAYLFYLYTRNYMHAETLADKTIVFSEHEVSKVVVMVTR